MARRTFFAPISVRTRFALPNRWDVIAALLVAGAIVALADASHGANRTLSALSRTPISLAPWHLIDYAAHTTLRMLAALCLSLAFTFTYATLAARNRRAEMLLIPLLDILQSVPILGFISVAIVFFMSLAPGRVLGAEFAAVFAIFTSQAWNMAFSFYQSLRTVPTELEEVARNFRFSPWMKFWRVDVPFALPQLIWNMMVSMSGGWFFVVASEAIAVGNRNIVLPGIGSYIAVAIAQRNLGAIFWAIGAMLIVILIYDQLLFRPLIAWVDKMRFEQEPGAKPPSSWSLNVLRGSRLIALMTAPFDALMDWSYRVLAVPATQGPTSNFPTRPSIWADVLWTLLFVAIALAALWRVATFISSSISWNEIGTVFGYGLLTLTRVLVLIALASVVWVPAGVLIGLRPRLTHIIQPIAQFLAAFPANLLFPIVVSAIVSLGLNPDIWLSPLMVLGTQWYILFNVIAGSSALPSELRDISTNFGVHGWLWWRKVALPSIFPYYVTGAITASGGSWNASIVAELVSWGHTKLEAKGLGSYIAKATAIGDYHRIVLGIAVMSLFVVALNRTFWRPLYAYAERKFRLG